MLSRVQVEDKIVHIVDTAGTASGRRLVPTRTEGRRAPAPVAGREGMRKGPRSHREQTARVDISGRARLPPNPRGRGVDDVDRHAAVGTAGYWRGWDPSRAPGPWVLTRRTAGFAERTAATESRRNGASVRVQVRHVAMFQQSQLAIRQPPGHSMPSNHGQGARRDAAIRFRKRAGAEMQMRAWAPARASPSRRLDTRSTSTGGRMGAIEDRRKGSSGSHDGSSPGSALPHRVAQRGGDPRRLCSDDGARSTKG